MTEIAIVIIDLERGKAKDNTEDTVTQERGEATKSGPRIDELALSTDEREIYNKLDIKMKKVFLESITKAREEGLREGIREGIEEERKKGVSLF
ncbi:6702_t:CDS:2 [Gigaspora margarita]|uniref:6702_t:CDS:1 n=1 Tax=Gigaspora margarita TaxID=4874 RepID=A0ABM8VXU3_GIGMA|nr:6702_t:CDS:2 [Gigaspora margarita]